MLSALDKAQLKLVLRSCPGSSKWQSQNELRTVANVCIKFEDAHMENPILSVYESSTTTVGEGWRSKKILVSPNRNCVISLIFCSSLTKISPKLA